MGMHMDPIALQIPDAVKISGLGRSTLYRAIQRGELPTRKAGKRTLILADDLRKYIGALPAPLANQKAKAA